MKCFYRLSAALCAAALCFTLAGCQNKANRIEISTPEEAAAAVPTATPEQSADAQAVTAAAEIPTILPETPDAGRSYVDETLFIGDSNTARYMMYADETGTAFTSLKNNIGVVSMGAGAITTLKCEQFKGDSQMYTIPDAVAKLKPKRIIICFGTNNLGGSSTDASSFIDTYQKGLQAIVDAWPYADLIVSAIPPLDKQRENTNLTMTQVDAYNAALVEMCEANGYKFLNSAEVLRDDATGWAKTDYTLSDGVHLSKTAVTAYFEYVRTHAYQTEDRRPQPLGTIPEPDGVPLGLISSDPIAVRGAKVPVEFVVSGGGSISGSTSQLVKKGGTCSTVTAVPDSGWAFDHWSASIGSAGSSASLSFTVPSNADAGGVVITAYFTPDVHEHEYVEVEGSKTAPGCETKGFVKERCNICGEVRERELDALGHDWDSGTVTREPAPGVAGERTFTCKRCGKTRVESIEALAAHQHTFDTLISSTPATCTEAGSETYQCSCGETNTITINPTGHNYVNGVCSNCGAPDPNQPVHEHTFDQIAEEKAPTCTEDGYVIYKCSCGVIGPQETRPATGHQFVDGICTVCGVPDPNYVQPTPPSSEPSTPDIDSTSSTPDDSEGSSSTSSASEDTAHTLNTDSSTTSDASTSN